MRNDSEWTKFAALFIAVIEVLGVTAKGQLPLAPNSSAKASHSMLPRNAVLPLTTVKRFFSEVSREASTGHNLTAVANVKATRSVIYTNSDSAKKVTITVDQYPTANDASSAYQEAVAKSKAVPGFRPVSAENLDQNAFVGTVTQEGETHIGLGALDGVLIVGVTLAGYDCTPENIAKLISLARDQERVVKTAVNRND
ncbi:MAG TPA: hypothetical protein VIW07_12520 [Candidatus Udaeobacter sp.]|jgi:hypothetical protein